MMKQAPTHFWPVVLNWDLDSGFTVARCWMQLKNGWKAARSLTMFIDGGISSTDFFYDNTQHFHNLGDITIVVGFYQLHKRLWKTFQMKMMIWYKNVKLINTSYGLCNCEG